MLFVIVVSTCNSHNYHFETGSRNLNHESYYVYVYIKMLTIVLNCASYRISLQMDAECFGIYRLLVKEMHVMMDWIRTCYL
jgi:hypothetical protein